MQKKYIVALDQGTTSSRTLIYNIEESKIEIIVNKEFEQIYPKPGWIEHDPEDILNSQLFTFEEAIKKSKIDKRKILSIGITNQRETVVVWDKITKKPVYNAIVWQCRRTSDYCETLKERKLEGMIKKKTGLVIDAYFSASKIKWILDNVDGAKELMKQKRLLAGTIDTYLIWNLTNKESFVTDYTNASRTMLFNIHTLKWDKELLDLFEVDESVLAKVVSTSGNIGTTSKDVVGEEIPITAIAGDQQSALFGQNCFESGSAKNTYGTGCFILMNTKDKPIDSKNNLLTTIAWKIDNKICYALEGSVFNAGSAIKWLRDEMRMIDSASETEAYAFEVEDNGGVYFVPAFTGLGAPRWNMYARGTIIGLTRGTEKSHVIRACLESIAFQSKDILDAMNKDSGIDLKELRVDGGASANNFLMQFQADIMGIDVIRPDNIETTAMGAIFLSGMGVGLWSFEDIKKEYEVNRIFKPQMEKEKVSKYYGYWEKAALKSMDWSK